MEKKILRKNKIVAEVTFKGQDMVLEEEVKIYEVSEFSTLPYTQNQKLGNHGKCSFTSNFERSSNLDSENAKKITETKT